MITIEEAKSGDETAVYGSVYLHSAYSPLKEAEKFSAGAFQGRFSTLLFIAPCLNYAGKLIRKNNSSIKLVSIYLHEIFFIRDDFSDFKWCYASSGEDLISFLNRALNETDVEGLKLAQWPASARLFGNEVSKLSSIITQHIRELHGNITTCSGFGKKLFSNFIKIFLNRDEYRLLSATDSPVFIAGSGPGLESSVDFIKKNRNRFILLSLPSSLSFLSNESIVPDLVISTDPGYYAAYHLSLLEDIPVAAPFTAGFFSGGNSYPVIPLNQNSYIESAVLTEDDHFLTIPSNGTVGGSALFLAKLLSSGPVFITGIDFSFIDILSHLRPHNFDSIIEQSSDRIKPLTDLYFKRNIPGSFRKKNGLRRSTKPLEVYKGWFSSRSDFFSDRCFFLDYHCQAPGSFRNISHKEAQLMLSGIASLNLEKQKAADIHERKERIISFLQNENKKIQVINNRRSQINSRGIFPYEMFKKTVIPHVLMPELLEIKRIFLYENPVSLDSSLSKLIKKADNFLESLKRYV